MKTNDHQGHNPNDAVEFAGLGCLGFVLVCAILALVWGTLKVVDLLMLTPFFDDYIRIIVWVLGLVMGLVIMHLYMTYRYFYGIHYQRKHESLNQTFERLD